jgi:hypothetical protein
MGERKVERRLAAILAADVAGYSRLVGEEGGPLERLKVLRRHNCGIPPTASCFCRAFVPRLAKQIDPPPAVLPQRSLRDAT